MFETHHRPIVEAMTSESEELSAYTERAMSYMIRIAALFALADKRTQIGAADLSAALALVSYSVESVKYVLIEAGTGGIDGAEMKPVGHKGYPKEADPELVEKILQFVKAAGGEGRTKLAISEMFPGPAQARENAIAASMENGLIRRFALPSTGGRPTHVHIYSGPSEEAASATSAPQPVIVRSVAKAADSPEVSKKARRKVPAAVPAGPAAVVVAEAVPPRVPKPARKVKQKPAVTQRAKKAGSRDSLLDDLLDFLG